MSEYMQNQMDNLIQSGINERENMISELDKWKNIAKEQLQLLQMIENKIKMEELEDEFYEELIQIQFSVTKLKTTKDEN